MPVPDGDVRVCAEVVEPQELIVDEGLERADVDGADARGRVLIKQGEDGEKGCLRLAGGSGGREQDVVIRVEDRLCRGDLDATQALPLVVVDEVLDERRKPVERAHGPPSSMLGAGLLDLELSEVSIAGLVYLA